MLYKKISLIWESLVLAALKGVILCESQNVGLGFVAGNLVVFHQTYADY